MSASPSSSSLGLPIAFACGAVAVAYIYNNFVAGGGERNETENATATRYSRNYLAVFCVGLALGFGYTYIFASTASAASTASTASAASTAPSSLIGAIGGGAGGAGGAESMADTTALNIVMAEIDLSEPDF